MMARLTRNLGKLNLKYLLIEIVLIVIGINVGLWFSELSEKKRLKQQETELLSEMLLALENDQADMQENLKIHQDAIAACERLLVPADSLSIYQAAFDLVTAWNYTYFNCDYTSYESLKNYGLRLIRDPKLRRDIVRLYNSSYRAVEEASRYHRRRTENFDPIMVELFDFKNGKYVFRDNKLRSVADNSYLIKGLSNSHSYVSYTYNTNTLPAVDSLIINIQAALE